MKNKNSLKIIIPVLLISSSALILFQVKKNISQNISQTSTKSNIDDLKSNITPINFQKLTVLTNRCRGCGRCVRLDPAHFEMINGIAKVTSSTDLNSKNLIIAINNCPTQAISLE